MDISLYKYYAAGIIVFVGVMSAGEYLFSRSYERLPHFAARWWLTHVAVLALSLGLEILHFYLDTVTKNIYQTNIFNPLNNSKYHNQGGQRRRRPPLYACRPVKD